MKLTLFVAWLAGLAGLSGCGNDAMMMTAAPPDLGPTFLLTVSATPGGHVVSDPPGIDCGGTCSHAFSQGTQVALKAQADADHLFLHWTNACDGDRPCTLVMNEALTVAPVFDARYQCSKDGWCQVHPFPSKDNLWLLELVDDRNALIGGRNLLLGDGMTWAPVQKTFDGGLNDSAVRSRSPLDLWLLPDNGQLQRWDGKTFTALDTAGSNKALWGAWFATPDDGWVVGDTGTILRWNGSALAPLESGTQTILYSVWGAAADQVWMPGVKGLILYWNGKQIVQQPSGTTEDLNDIWGTTASDMWIVGNSGIILRYDGAAWNIVPSDTTDNVIACTGDKDSHEIWAVGDAGNLVYYNGSAWKKQDAGVQSGLRQVRVSPTHVWVIGFGGVILRKQR